MIYLIFAGIYIPAYLFDFLFKRNHILNMKEAIFWSIFWTLCGLMFGIVVLVLSGQAIATDYWSAYVAEKSLSVDNLFVILAICKLFGILESKQQTALSYGVLGAIVCRGLLLTVGSCLLSYAGWLMYPLSLLLILLAKKIAFSSGDPEPKGVDFAKKMGWSAFWTGVFVIELNDIIFATDSIPTVLGISHNPIVVVLSNIAAIQSLRSIFFVLSILEGKLSYLPKGVGIVLALVGLKNLITLVGSDLFHVKLSVNPVLWIGVILSVLGIAVVVSLLNPEKCETVVES